MQITTLQRLFKFKRAKLSVAFMVVTAVLFLIPAVSWAQNNPPIADAGEDQTIFVGQPTLLNGTATDPDGDPILNWQWTVESAPPGSSPQLTGDFAPDPVFQHNLAGDYVLSLVVGDGSDLSDPDFVTIHVVENQPPVAAADADVTSGPAPLTVQLDGTQSFDPEGNPLFFLWQIGDGSPPEQGATITHVYDLLGTYTATLTVEDDRNQRDIDSIVITVCEDGINCPPVADAGEDQTIFVDQSTLLDGRGSYGPDPGDSIVEWSWAIESAPPGSTPYFPDTITSRPVFSGNLAGDYVISLAVYDGTDWSLPDTVTIHVVENQPPVAVADADVTSGPAPLTVQFDGTQSYDPEGEELLYRWRFTDGTPDEWIASPTHEFEWPGTYTAILTVEDDWGQQDVDSIVITVTEPGTQSPQEMIEDLTDEVSNLVDTGSLRNFQGQRLIRLLDRALSSLDNGRTWLAKYRLNRFIRMVDRYIQTGRISATEGQILIDAANDTIEAING